jgi:hypothetical protein
VRLPCQRSGFLVLVPFFLVLPLFLSGGREGPAPGEARPVRAASGEGCAVDVGAPLEVSVEAVGPVRPGLPVQARVTVTARVLFDAVELRVLPPAGVTVLSTPAAELGLLRAGEARETAFTVVPGGGAPRRTVEVRVEGTVDGQRLAAGTVLNLVFEDEPRRVVMDAGGETVIEVPARRIG